MWQAGSPRRIRPAEIRSREFAVGRVHERIALRAGGRRPAQAPTQRREGSRARPVGCVHLETDPADPPAKSQVKRGSETGGRGRLAPVGRGTGGLVAPRTQATSAATTATPGRGTRGSSSGDIGDLRFVACDLRLRQWATADRPLTLRCEDHRVGKRVESSCSCSQGGARRLPSDEMFDAEHAARPSVA